MKRIVPFILGLLFVINVSAQEDSPTGYSSFFSLAGSRYEPAVLGDDHDNIHISVINAYLWAGNNTFTIADMQTMTSGSLTPTDMDGLIGKLKDNNRLGFGTTIEPLNVGVRINRGDKKELLTVSAGFATRFEANLLYPNELFQLFWKGNKQYAGQTIEFPFALNASLSNEYTIGAAMPIPININENFEFRGGLRLKYIQGIFAAYTEKAQVSMFTEQDGKYIDLGYDYRFHSTFDYLGAIDDDSTTTSNTPSFKPGDAAGKGFAFDLGFSGHYKERWFANVNLLDIGSVTFKGEDNLTLSNNGSIRFEGVGVKNPLNESRRKLDTAFTEIVNGAKQERGQDFTMPYPQRLRFHGSYKIPKEDKNGDTYYQHSIGATVIQGFKDVGNATKSTYMAAAYTYNLKSHLEVGTNFGFRGYNIAEIGFFMAVRAGFFRLGIGSGNLIGAFAKKIATGADVNFNMTMAF